MSRFAFVGIMIIACLLSACLNGGEGELSMFIKLNKTTFFLGESTPVEIIYENLNDTTIIIENPSKSLNLYMHVISMKNEEDMHYAMGKLIVTHIDKDSGQFALVEPPKEEIKIEPRSSFKFSSDLNIRLYLHPGKFKCFLREDEKEKSNHAEMAIKFTKKSVDSLFELARDKNREYGRREWAMEWVQKVYSEFELKLSFEEDSDDIVEQNEASNKVIYEKFRKWWDEKKDTNTIEELLKKVEYEYF